MFGQFKLIALAVLVAGALFVGWHYKATLGENKRLTIEIQTANSTIEKLDDKFEAEKLITKNTESILDEIRNSPDSDDGPVAPVLDRVLDRL